MSIGGEHGDDAMTSLRQFITPLADKWDADVLVYSGFIMPPADDNLIELSKGRRPRRNVLLLLSTMGGSADVAYRIGRCLQKRYDKFTLFVDSQCKSAGTLIALAADEIVMSDKAELGPLDVQLSKPDELSEWTSGLTPIQALSTLRQQTFGAFEDYFLKMRFRSGLQITTKTALEIASKLTIGLFSPVFEQLDPMRLGEIQRAMAIAHHYGGRLARKNLRDGALDALIAEYPSHGFIIDRVEAGELFFEVREPNTNESKLAHLLQGFIDAGEGEDGALIEFVCNPPDNKADDKAGKTNESQKNAELDAAPEAPRRRASRSARKSQPKSVRSRNGANGKAGQSDGVAAKDPTSRDSS